MTGALPEPVRALLGADDAEVEARWLRVREWLRGVVGRKPSMEGVLFLIGVRNQGLGYAPELEKERKQDLIMEGTYCAFEAVGLYERVGAEADGGWIWEPTVAQVPKLPIEQQEKLLKLAVVSYFEPFMARPAA